MNKSLYIVAFSLAFATTGIAQNNEGQDKVIDLGTQTTTELRKTQAVSTIYSDELDKNATTSPYNAIYGLLPGLSVMQNTSWGTDKSRLNVRGRGSLNGDTPRIYQPFGNRINIRFERRCCYCSLGRQRR